MTVIAYHKRQLKSSIYVIVMRANYTVDNELSYPEKAKKKERKDERTKEKKSAEDPELGADIMTDREKERRERRLEGKKARNNKDHRPAGELDPVEGLLFSMTSLS